MMTTNEPPRDDAGRIPISERKQAIHLAYQCASKGAALYRDPDGDSLCLHGANLVQAILPEIHRLKSALLEVLQESTIPTTLNPDTVAEHFGTPNPDPYQIRKVESCVRTAVGEFLDQIANGFMKHRIRQVRNRPVTDWIDMDTLTRLLQEGPRIGSGGFLPTERRRERPQGSLQIL